MACILLLDIPPRDLKRLEYGKKPGRSPFSSRARRRETWSIGGADASARKQPPLEAADVASEEVPRGQRLLVPSAAATIAAQVGARSPDRAPGRDRRSPSSTRGDLRSAPGHGPETVPQRPAAGRLLHPFAKRSKRSGQARDQSSSSFFTRGKTNAARTGAGIGDFDPFTDLQITSFSSKSSAASSFAKSNCSDRSAPHAVALFFSFKSTFGTTDS